MAATFSTVSRYLLGQSVCEHQVRALLDQKTNSIAFVNTGKRVLNEDAKSDRFFDLLIRNINRG